MSAVDRKVNIAVLGGFPPNAVDEKNCPRSIFSAVFRGKCGNCVDCTVPKKLFVIYQQIDLLPLL